MYHMTAKRRYYILYCFFFVISLVFICQSDITESTTSEKCFKGRYSCEYKPGNNHLSDVLFETSVSTFLVDYLNKLPARQLPYKNQIRQSFKEIKTNKDVQTLFNCCAVKLTQSSTRYLYIIFHSLTI